MRIPIVDENDVEIGLKERTEIEPTDIYRVSALWITNSKGEALIAQRALTKKRAPGRWSCAVAGTVDEGETYEINILKETQEEIGITLSAGDITKIAKVRIDAEGGIYFCQWYETVVDKNIEEFVLRTEEVADAKWISIEQLQKDIAESPDTFTIGLRQTLPLILSKG